MKRTKLFITGGHVTPAMAVIEEIRLRKAGWDVVFVGRTHAISGSRHASAEYALAKKHGWRFLPITTGRLHRDSIVRLLVSLIYIPIGFIQSLVYCATERPDAILSFGGYVAAPVALAGYLLAIPIVTHEQTTIPGRANRFISRFAKKICLTFPDTANIFPKQRTVVTGLPLRQSLFQAPSKPPFLVSSTKPLVYVTGGSTGAVSLNKVIFAALPRLAERFVVVHQTGDVSLDAANIAKEQLDAAVQAHYIPVSYVDEAAMAWLLHTAMIVIGRAGANTVMEIAVLGQVAVFVPLPWSGEGEQEANAQWLATHGGARVLNQSDVTAETLMTVIDEIHASYSICKKKATQFAKILPQDGASRVVDVLATLVA